MNVFIERLVDSFPLILPEIVLVFAASAFFLVGPFVADDRGRAPAGARHGWGLATLATLAVAIWFWLRMDLTDVATPGPFRLDDLAWFVHGLTLIGGAALALVAWSRVDDSKAAELYASLLFVTAGTALVGASNDLVSLFLSLELVSIPTYVLLYLSRSDDAGQEATLKYFLLSVFASAVTLFGFSYLFGTTGTTDLVSLHAALASGAGGALPPTLAIAAAAIVGGLGFRLAAVPFHFYAPDTFQGTSTVGAALLSFVPKVAGLVALARIFFASTEALDAAGWTFAEIATPMLAALSILSMTIGNCLALVQKDVRRMLAYSGVAHSGYLLVGLVSMDGGDPNVGLSAMCFYLAAYGAMSIGAFAALAAAGSRTDDASGSPVDRIQTFDDLAGFGRTNPFAAAVFAVALFSMIGLPPTAGFLGKLNLLVAAWSSGWQWLAIAMLVNAAIAAYYYLRTIGAIYLASPQATERRGVAWSALAAGGICVVLTIGLFAAPDWILQALASAPAN